MFVDKARELLTDPTLLEEGGVREVSTRGNALINLPALYQALRAHRKQLQTSFRNMGQARSVPRLLV